MSKIDKEATNRIEARLKRRHLMLIIIIYWCQRVDKIALIAVLAAWLAKIQ